MSKMPAQDDIFLFLTHFPIMITELLVSIMFYILAIVILNKWRERRTKPTLYLALGLLSISTGIFIAFIGLASWFLSWIFSGLAVTKSPFIYWFSLPLGYSFVIIYDIFLFLFTIHIFLDEKEKRVIPIAIIGVVLIAFLFLPTNYWGLDPLVTDPPSTRVAIQAVFLIFNMVIYILLGYLAIKASRKADERITRIGFQTIAVSQFFNISIFVFFLLDAVIILLNDPSPGYSLFIYLAWIFALVAGFLAYLGYILPKWFRKLFKE